MDQKEIQLLMTAEQIARAQDNEQQPFFSLVTRSVRHQNKWDC